MEELREEVGVKKSFRRKLVRSRIKWAEHVEIMEGERLTKRAENRLYSNYMGYSLDIYAGSAVRFRCYE